MKVFDKDICLKRKRRLIFTCIGSHDESRRWIENNRDHQKDIDEYEKNLLARIDEKMLREIFAGLCQWDGSQ